jgi:Leucine-rich repeat (LRR) protein
MIRARSHKYPDDEAVYLDTTYFDEEESYLDIGFQRLKVLNLKSYPEFGRIKMLFVDHNSLTTLPDPKYVPNLTSLNCSHNKLNSIPFYPNLVSLMVSNNRIKNINVYQNSILRYVDCSFNLGFELHISLPHCKQIYLNDCELKLFKIELFPNLTILDLENNQIKELGQSSTLIELGAQNNFLKDLPAYPNLLRLYVDDNQLVKIRTHDKLLLLSATNNQIVQIHSQPSLEKLYAKRNQLVRLGSTPKLKTIDICYNAVESYALPNEVEHAYLYFNPLTSLDLQFNCIKELQISFGTYQYIYQKYESDFQLVDIHTSIEKLDHLLSKMNRTFNQKMIEMIKNKISKVQFGNRDVHLFKLSMIVYLKIFDSDSVQTADQMVQTKEFVKLLELLKDIYYKTMVITLYFNGYLP